jgi:hypothetical protein
MLPFQASTSKKGQGVRLFFLYSSRPMNGDGTSRVGLLKDLARLLAVNVIGFKLVLLVYILVVVVFV